jgi:hypothetical protein
MSRFASPTLASLPLALFNFFSFCLTRVPSSCFTLLSSLLHYLTRFLIN